jgi:hypothetical protein
MLDGAAMAKLETKIIFMGTLIEGRPILELTI